MLNMCFLSARISLPSLNLAWGFLKHGGWQHRFNLTVGAFSWASANYFKLRLTLPKPFSSPVFTALRLWFYVKDTKCFFYRKHSDEWKGRSAGGRGSSRARRSGSPGTRAGRQYLTWQPARGHDPSPRGSDTSRIYCSPFDVWKSVRSVFWRRTVTVGYRMTSVHPGCPISPSFSSSCSYCAQYNQYLMGSNKNGLF